MSDNPFPFKCKLKGDNNVEITVDVVQISHGGMRTDSLKTPLGVNKVFTASFEFPLTHKTAEVTVVVFRTYAEIVDVAGSPRRTRHMNELVYKQPSREFNEFLVQFLAILSNKSKV